MNVALLQQMTSMKPLNQIVCCNKIQQIKVTISVI